MGDVIQNLLVVKSKGPFKTTFTKKQRVCSVCHQLSHIKQKCPQDGGVNGNNDNDNAHLYNDFISANTMNTMSTTTATSLNFPAHEDEISRGTIDFI